MEIHKLHEMLTEAGIEHCFLDRTPEGYNEVEAITPPEDRTHLNWGWQVLVFNEDGVQLCSAIEGFGTYGYGVAGEQGDSIELWDITMKKPMGWLTAEEVFERIKVVANGTD